MPEPVASAGAATMVGLVGGMTMTALKIQTDPGMVLGVICGAFVYLMRSREPSHWRKAAYFLISLVGGYNLSAWAIHLYPSLSAWLVAFAVTASIVTVAVLVLDWVERNVQPTLDQFRVWFVGKFTGGGKDDTNA